MAIVFQLLKKVPRRPSDPFRIAAMVSASVFDGVNGIDPRYRPIHVRPNAPDGASPRARPISPNSRFFGKAIHR